MRFRLNLEVRHKPCVIPLSYQSGLQAWIYKQISEASPEFATFLHNKGYQHGNRGYKPFTFSNIDAKPYEIKDDRLKIMGNRARFEISMYVHEIAEKFVQGVFAEQELYLGDGWSEGIFDVTSVEVAERPVFASRMRFRSETPICISQAQERNGKSMPQYLSPEDLGYNDLFFNNLINKYKSTLPEMSQDYAPDFGQEHTFDLRILSRQVRKRLVTLKSHTNNPIKIRGYAYDFEIIAPPELIKCGYYAGFGEKTASGFGFCRVL